jgi:hypothetical protein
VRAPQHPTTQARLDRLRLTRRATLASLATLALATSCRAGVASLITNSNGTNTPADQLLSGLANRYTNVHRDAKLSVAREKLAQGALVPSRIFDDTAAWSTLTSSTVRTFGYSGTFVNGQYRMYAMPPGALPPRPSSPGDTRHVITLTHLAAEEYRWDVITDFSFGASGSSNVAAIFRGLFASAERRTERDVRADYRTTFPRTSATLGELFSVDSIRSTPRADGSTFVDLTIAIHPDGLAPRYPAFAAYLKKYVSPGVTRLVLRDRNAPTTWFIVDVRRNRINFTFRSRDGRLLPLLGPARPMPDSLELESLVSAKFGIFRVGFEKLRSDFIISRGAPEPAWTLVFRREPEWKLPLFTENLIRSSLRRPFQKEGAFFRVSLRDDVGQTLLSRRGQLTVAEGTILRFLGRLGTRAYSDLSARVEKEIQDFLRDVYTAMRADARGLSD